MTYSRCLVRKPDGAVSMVMFCSCSARRPSIGLANRTARRAAARWRRLRICLRRTGAVDSRPIAPTCHGYVADDDEAELRRPVCCGFCVTGNRHHMYPSRRSFRTRLRSPDPGAPRAFGRFGGPELGHDLIDRLRPGFNRERAGRAPQRAIAVPGAVVKVQRNDRDFLALDVLPDVQFRPVQERVNPDVRARREVGLELVPEFRRLIRGVPLHVGVARRSAP